MNHKTTKMQNDFFTSRRARIGFHVAMVILLIVIPLDSFAATFTSTNILTTTWSSSTSWMGGGVGTTPGNGDIVIVASGTIITIDASIATLGNLTVNGTLEFQSGTSRSLTGTSLTIASGGIFRVNAAGTASGHVLSLSGSITNNGILDFYANGGSAAASITFTGSANAAFSGTGATTNISTITINKGTTPASILDLSTGNFKIRGVNTNVAGFLTLTNGTFKISGSFAMNNRVFTTANYTIGSTTGFNLNNANFTVEGQNGNVGWYGTVTVNAGTFNIGSASDNELYYYGATAVYIVNGGVLNIASSMQPYYDLNNATYSVNYTQTGGIVTVNTLGNTFGGSTGKGFPSMWITQSSSFTMSGGSIVVRLENTLWNYDFDCSAATRSITGGTLQLGDASSGAAKRYGIAGYFPNILITNTSGNHSAEFYSVTGSNPYVYLTTVLQSNTALDANTNSLSTTFAGDLTIATGAAFDAGNVTHYVQGNWTNNGAFTYRGSTIDFNGSSTQQILGSSATTFYDVILDNGQGLTLAPGTGVVTTINDILTFTNGQVTIGNFDLVVGIAASGGFFGHGTSAFVITNGTGVLKRYNIGTGQRTSAIFPIGINSGSYTPITLTVVGSTTVDNFSARVSQTVYSAGTIGNAYTSNVVDRTWNVSEGTIGGSNVTLTAQWNAGIELPSFSRTNCLVSHYTGGAWNNTTGLAAASGSNPYTRTSGTRTSLSPFAITSIISLPIELLDFDAKSEKEDVMINWSTASEMDNDYFTIERGTDGIHFESIGTVKGAGNSTTILHYNQVDKKPLKGVSYYRLKQTDYNGTSAYSQIIAIEFVLFNDIIIYYNNLHTEAYISYQLKGNTNVHIEIIDALGRIIETPVLNEFQTHGNYLNSINVINREGIYFVRIYFNQEIHTVKLIL